MWQDIYKSKLKTPAEAIKLSVKSGDRVCIGFVSDCAYVLANELWNQKDSFDDITIITSQSLKPIPLFMSKEPNPFSICTPFLGPFERFGTMNGRPTEFTSFHLSQLDLWFRQIGRANVALLEVSEPDENGNMCFGQGGSCVAEYLLETADTIVLQVNREVPYIYGEHTFINVKDATYIVEADDPLPDLKDGPIDPDTQAISDIIMEHVPDGATVQLGIGGLSTAIGYALKDKNDLGIYTEIFSTPYMDLMKNGNVTNKHKGYMDGISVFAAALGSAEMYHFMDHNKDIYCGLFPHVNDPRNIMKNRNMISINAAMAFSIYGESAADCLGYHQQSAVGGQIDFVRGAQWSEGGKSFIASNSSFIDKKTGKRVSKIMFNLPEGTAVTTPRADVQYVATEFGCVNLKTLTMSDRVRAMISLAHPDFRDELTQKAKDHKLI